jgi:hypothetical protein
MIKYNFVNNTIEKVTDVFLNGKLHNFGYEMSNGHDNYYYILNDPKKQKYILVINDDTYDSFHKLEYRWLYTSATEEELLKHVEKHINDISYWKRINDDDYNVIKILKDLKKYKTAFIKTREGKKHYFIFKI